MEELTVRINNGLVCDPLRFEGTREEINRAFYAGMDEATIKGNASVTCSTQHLYAYTAPMNIVDKLFSSMLIKKLIPTRIT